MNRRLLDVSGECGRPTVLPIVEVVGTSPGPALCLLAGVHGCEYTAMAALRRTLDTIDETRLRGRLVAVPIVNVEAFRVRSPFVSPADGKNLNRCFPGDPNGTPSDRLAAVVFERFIATSDYMIDLHSGDLVEALEPFALYDESTVTEQARAMVEAFDLPIAICAHPMQRIEGTTIAAAADRGIPAMTAEAGGVGVVDPRAATLLQSGIHNVLSHLGMLPHHPRASTTATRTFRRFVWLHAEADGWWTAVVSVGAVVAAGDTLGTIEDMFGRPLVTVVAPEGGTLLFLTVNPSVVQNGVLLGMGADPTESMV